MKIHTPFDPAQSCGLANVGVDADGLRQARPSTSGTSTASSSTPIIRDDYQGIRVTPNVYTTLDEIDTFAQIVEDIAKKGTI